ncbi:MAG: hypothetical protein IJP89_09325, partial [Synergistaceae bacterium]|nr:hypothetical protein [Synergistaceae bacterium]
ISCKVLEGDGDFRSPECLELLREADIVVTNPPHSLLREYIALLIEYGKEFLILGNMNAITYKEIFPLIMHNQMWLGVSNGDRHFRVPHYYEARETRYWEEEQPDGTIQKFRSLGNICWFTNMDHHRHNETLCLFRKYHDDPSKYPHYDNYDAIEVSKVVDIPCDWLGVMGVPVTFLDKYNPKQFEIVGRADANIANEDNPYHIPGFSDKGGAPMINGRFVYKRILIRRIGGIM